MILLDQDILVIQKLKNIWKKQIYHFLSTQNILDFHGKLLKP